MSRWYWLKRFITAFIIAWAVLFAAHLVRGYDATAAAGFGLLWGAVAAAIFVLTGYVRYRRNPACMVPRSRDT